MEIREENCFSGPHFYRDEGVDLDSKCWRYAVAVPEIGTWGVDGRIDSRNKIVDAIIERVPGSSSIHNQLRGKRKNLKAIPGTKQFYDLLSVGRFENERFRHPKVKDLHDLPFAFPSSIRIERAGSILGEYYRFRDYLIAVSAVDRPSDIAFLLIAQYVLPLTDKISRG
jgi:hypothetical protein